MAAAEVSRSSSGSADSYVGSLISLTSKSEIRYEGVLFNINTEESSIGLRNVRSFGTEGRKKDGPQVPPSDKIYEYILFRGSDIKDLQVKSSPPTQNTAAIHNDPAIIQSHYPQPAIVSTSLASSSIVPVPDPTSQSSQLGQLRPAFQGNLPLYQPGGSLPPWGSAPPPTTNGGGLAMPMYWQGYYGPTSGLQAQPRTLLQPPPGLSMPPSMQQPVQYPAMNLALPTGASNLPASQLSENPPLLPPFNTASLNPQPSMPPAHSSTMFSDSPVNLIADKASSQTLLSAAPSTTLPLVTPLTSGLDKSTIMPLASDKTKTVPGPLMTFKNMSESASSVAGLSTSVLNDGTMPSLITPGQLLQPGPPAVSSSQSLQIAQKDVEVVQVSSSVSSSPSAPVAPSAAPPAPAVVLPSPAAEVQEPILPLPSPPDRKLSGAPAYTHHRYRGGRERGRGNGSFHHATRFTEDFDFTAMNEKFKKDEIWGHLGKSNKAQEDGDDWEDEENTDSSKADVKPVYVKDDFFDSLSCDALAGGSYDGRPRFSEQRRRDTETFGEFSRHRGGGRGGRGPYRGGGRARGSYGGRGGYGYGYGGRGRGFGMSR